MKNRTIGVIGLGSIGMRHAENLIIMGHKVIGYDPLTNNDQSDLDFLLKRSDAIVVASPTSNHANHLVRCAGMPTFIEKPIADRQPVVGGKNAMMVGYNLRFHACVKQAKKWLGAGLIGEPLWANFTCAQYNDKAAYRRDGVILNWSHEIDLALYLLGPAVVASSSTKLEDGQDTMTDILLTHEKGCRSAVHLDYSTKQEVREFIIAGTSGLIKANLVRRIAELVPPTDGPCKVIWGNDSFDDNYKEEMQAFLDRIDGKETIGCTGEEGLRVLDICLKVREQAGL